VLAEPDRGGPEEEAQAVIIATGSEVQLALHAQAELAKLKIAVRVVSVPSTTTFDRQSGLQEGRAAAGCRAWRSRPASPTAGGSTAAPPWSASTPSAKAHRRRALFKHFGLTAAERGRHGAQGSGQTPADTDIHSTQEIP
jgi:transketolase